MSANDEFAEKLREMMEGASSGDVPEAFRGVLEAQRTFLLSYQKILDRQMSDDSMTDQFDSMVKMFMSSSMELLRFTRESRKRMLEFQSAALDNYIGMVNELFESAGDAGDAPGDRPLYPHGNTGDGAPEDG